LIPSSLAKGEPPERPRIDPFLPSTGENGDGTLFR
jgi:hypothetical protein